MSKVKEELAPQDYDPSFVLPGCTFGSLLSPAGRSAIRIAEELRRRAQIDGKKS